MDKSQINRTFDRQIILADVGRVWIWRLHKDLFNYTLNFTLKDWNAVRNEQYWEEVEAIMQLEGLTPSDKELAKKNHTLKCVIRYLNRS